MKCPNCKSPDGVREILYGLPIQPVDEEKYAIGGCCISEEDPTRKCIRCGWKGRYIKRNLGLGNEIKVVELKDISTMSDTEIDSYAQQIWKKLDKPKKGE
jgi:hypothetical protein